jgi:hypothetical protein
MHVLSTTNGQQVHPNAYINLARFFAPTNNVVLFPGRLPVVDRQLYQQLANLALDTPAVVSLTAPSFPAFPCVPIAMTKNYSVWCTERHFLGSTRANDWEQCVWQIWLYELGLLGQVISEVHNSIDQSKLPEYGVRRRL